MNDYILGRYVCPVPKCDIVHSVLDKYGKPHLQRFNIPHKQELP